ncbi:CMRF35-like molecule 2 [Nothobranchius furzeri]|uniref:CMRF35-like molecule 2 n=1 Tax=Nothobranchius furzeri TaxID=105023 RepID=UPI0039049FD3
MEILCLFLLFQRSLQLWCDKSQITAHVGGEFTIACQYDTSRYLLSKKYWCRGSSRRTCEVLLDSDGVTKGSYTHRSHIVDARRRGLFVKVTQLQAKDSGEYWIGIDKIYADIMTSVTLKVTKVPVSKPRLWPLTSLVDRQTCWGESVIVRCESTKGTDISYAWYQRVLHEDVLHCHSPYLSLHCSTVTSSTDYFCSASNSVGSEQSDVLSVQVLVSANGNCIYAVNIPGERCFLGLIKPLASWYHSDDCG